MQYVQQNIGIYITNFSFSYRYICSNEFVIKVEDAGDLKDSRVGVS